MWKHEKFFYFLIDIRERGDLREVDPNLKFYRENLEGLNKYLD
jgi:hypothetical protein